MPVMHGAGPHYISTTKIVRGLGSALCPYGWKLTRGGAGPLPDDSFYTYTSDEYALTGSYPSLS